MLVAALMAGPASAQSLFIDDPARSADAAAPVPGAHALRARTVLLDLGIAGGLAGARSASPADGTLELNLFPGLTVTATPEQRSTAPNGATVWTGGVAGDKFGHAVLVINGTDVTGSVIAGSQVFEIRPLGQGRHRIREIDQASFPDNHNDFRDVPNAAPSPLPLPQDRAAAPDTVMPKATSRVTLLGLYTPEASAGSYNIADEIVLATAVTNQIYARSGIPATLDLVGLREYRNVYDDGDLETQLDVITADPSIRPIRDAVQADLVTLISENSASACGIAWLGPSPSYAFSVIARDCAISNLSFPHEIGHNLGAQHDRYVVSSPSSTAYNYGYVDKTARVRTVMAYNNDCAASGFNCTRVGYFSSPSLSLNGRPLGSNSPPTNNVRTVTTGAAAAENFRSGTPPTLVIPQTGMWWNSTEGGRGYAIEYYPASGNLFFGSFLYTTDGAATWYVATCALTGGNCSGPLMAHGGGSTLTSSAASGAAPTGAVGQIALNFSTASTGTMTWPGGTVALTRYPIEGTDGSLSPDLDGAVQNGWYYATTEGGSGWFFETQAASPNRMFALAYMYNAAGRPTWYLATGAMTTSTLFEGRLIEYAGGGALTGPMAPGMPYAERGAVSVQFGANRTARVTLPTRRISLVRYRL